MLYLATGLKKEYIYINGIINPLDWCVKKDDIIKFENFFGKNLPMSVHIIVDCIVIIIIFWKQMHFFVKLCMIQTGLIKSKNCAENMLV